MDINLEFRNKRFTDAGVGLQYFATALKQDFERVGPVLAKQLEAFLKGLAGAMTKLHSGPWPAGTTPKTLSKRTGTALKSIQDSVKVTGNTFSTIQGRIGGIFYLKTQEFGATIRPKKAKYLAVPLPTALDNRGVPIRPGPRHWENTFVATSKNGNLLIFQRRGKTITPLYVLLKQVKIPPRLGMRVGINAGKQVFIDRAIAAMVKELRDHPAPLWKV